MEINWVVSFVIKILKIVSNVNLVRRISNYKSNIYILDILINFIKNIFFNSFFKNSLVIKTKLQLKSIKKLS